MSDMQESKRIAEIKARLALVAPGPWHTLNNGSDIFVGNWSDPWSQKEIRCGYDGVSVDNFNTRHHGVYAENTAEFIAHAREDIPRLVEAIEGLMRLNEDKTINHQVHQFLETGVWPVGEK